MSYNRVGTPKFYIDAMLLARAWGEIETENPDGLHYLNPSNVKTFTLDSSGSDYMSIIFKNRYWTNALTHLFVLGHNFHTDGVKISYRTRKVDDTNDDYLLAEGTLTNENGWDYYELNHAPDKDNIKTTFKISVEEGTTDTSILFSEISAGWNYTIQHSPDLELTQSFSNESIKTQTTLWGHTLPNAGWNHQPAWIRQAWTGTDQNTTAENRIIFPTGRRSWSLKFSYLSDNDSDNPLFPETYNSDNGIFKFFSTGAYMIKSDFLSKVYHGTNSYQLPFIFQPNTSFEEYAICRINSDTATFTQTSNNTYDISLDITEVW